MYDRFTLGTRLNYGAKRTTCGFGINVCNWDFDEVGSPTAIDRCRQRFSAGYDDHGYVGNLQERPLPVLVGSCSISRLGRPLDRAATRLVLSRSRSLRRIAFGMWISGRVRRSNAIMKV